MNHNFVIEDKFLLGVILCVIVKLSKYNLDFDDVKIGDTINNEYEILEKDKMKDILFGYSKKHAAYKVKKIDEIKKGWTKALE